jgi:hypothetical protein
VLVFAEDAGLDHLVVLGDRESPIPNEGESFGGDWETKLKAPVNEVLPVGRTYLKRLWAAFGER